MKKLAALVFIFPIYAVTQLWAQQLPSENGINIKYQRALDIRSSNSDSSLIYIHQIIDWAKANDQPQWLVKSHKLLDEIYYYRNEREQSFDYLVEALSISKENSFIEDEIDILHAIGLHYSRSARRANKIVDEDKLRTAIEYHQEAITLAEAHGFPILASSGYNHSGVCLWRLGELDNALKSFQKSEDYSRSADDSIGLGYTLDYMGGLLDEMGQKSKAKMMLLEALEVRKALKDTFPYAINLNNIGEFYLREKDYNKAKAYLDSSFQLSSSKLYQDLAIHTASLLSSVYENSNRFDLAYGLKKQEMRMMDTLYSINRAKSLIEMEAKYEAAQKDKALLEQQQTIQQKELDLRKRTIWLISSAGLLLLIAGMLYYLFKRKELVAKQAALELKLGEERERANIQEERLRISRELHDNIGSYLTLINASVEQIPEMSPGQITDNLPELQKTLALSMRELRKTVWLLNNQEITMEAIALRLRDFFKPLNQNGTKITVRSEGNTEKVLTDIQATHLFRVIQEAVSNAYKYAKAQHIRILLDTRENICFSISDDGVGFEISSARSGNGLRNMKSRMTELRGEIYLTSEPGKGTTVEGRF